MPPRRLACASLRSRNQRTDGSDSHARLDASAWRCCYLQRACPRPHEDSKRRASTRLRSNPATHIPIFGKGVRSPSREWARVFWSQDSWFRPIISRCRHRDSIPVRSRGPWIEISLATTAEGRIGPVTGRATPPSSFRWPWLWPRGKKVSVGTASAAVASFTLRRFSSHRGSRGSASQRWVGLAHLPIYQRVNVRTISATTSRRDGHSHRCPQDIHRRPGRPPRWG